MQLGLRELASLPDTPKYPPITISEATRGTSICCFSNYLKTHLSDFTPICVILMIVLYVITQIKLLTIFDPYLVHCESSMYVLDIADVMVIHVFSLIL